MSHKAGCRLASLLSKLTQTEAYKHLFFYRHTVAKRVRRIAMSNNDSWSNGYLDPNKQYQYNGSTYSNGAQLQSGQTNGQ